MAQRLHKLLAVGGINGAVEALERLVGELPGTGADAVAVVGDLGGPSEKPAKYRAIFKVLGDARRTAFWVPGSGDAPLHDYLRESYNMEIVYPFLHGLHGTAALGPGHVLFAGMGGEIVDGADAWREEVGAVRSPGWEAEYRLKVIREFDEHQKVLLFATRPAHKGLHERGSEAVAQIIKTYNPRVAIVGGPHPSHARLARTLVVCPGRLDQGQYAIVDLRGFSVAVASVDQQPI